MKSIHKNSTSLCESLLSSTWVCALKQTPHEVIQHTFPRAPNTFEPVQVKQQYLVFSENHMSVDGGTSQQRIQRIGQLSTGKSKY